MIAQQPSPPVLVIIADDLTGALDSSAPFADHGLLTVVAMHPQYIAGALSSGAKVIAVNTQSRDTDEATASGIVAEVLAQLPRRVQLFKKIDSRLKGNIAAELSAFDYSQLLVVPAIPEFGRVVSNGMLSGFGIKQPISVADALGAAASSATIPDITTTVDLLAALDLMPPDTLLAGARGLALALAQKIGARHNTESPLLPTPLTGPITIVAGSTDPITLHQIETLKTRFMDTCYIAAPNGKAISAHTGFKPVCDITLMQAVAGSELVDAVAAAQDLACSVVPSCIDGRRGLVLTGGATAESILNAMAVELLTVQGELLPGVPLSCAAGYYIVTKSGGFGDADVLATIAGQFNSRTKQ